MVTQVLQLVSEPRSSNDAKGAMGLITPMTQKDVVGPCKACWVLEDLAVVCMTLQFVLHVRRASTHAVKKLYLDRAFNLPM